jgi:hypothetical protein
MTARCVGGKLNKNGAADLRFAIYARTGKRRVNRKSHIVNA